MYRNVTDSEQDNRWKDIEVKIALQCAPLIGGLKVSNLLIIPPGVENYLKSILMQTGISYFRLFPMEDRTVYLVFRRYQLDAYLRQETVQQILLKEGYQRFCLGNILSTFQKRYQNYMEGKEEFPHEMGVLLGYPVEDVKGFIKNEGKNFLYSGYWKVYDNMPEKVRLFQQFDWVKATLIQILSEGISMRDIIQKAQAIGQGIEETSICQDAPDGSALNECIQFGKQIAGL